MTGFRSTAEHIGRKQTESAIKLLDRTDSDFLRMPWGTLDDVVSGMSAGDIWFIGGFSGDGKTTALTSAVDCWYEAGKRIYYLGLESRPNVLKTHWACKRVGLDAGEVLSGKALRWPDWKERKAELVAMLRSLDESDSAAQVHFSPMEFVDADRLKEAMKNAREFGADVFILDHIDHIEGAQGSPYEVSRGVCMTLLQEAQSSGIRCLVATQFNNEAVRGNRAGRYLPPQPHYVFMGSHKRQIASGMLGLYRPLKQGLDADTLRQFQHGGLEPIDVCEPDTMGVVCMKHRLFGKYEGKRVFLGVKRGRVVDLPHRDQPNTHGIRTNRDYAR
jgi:KaiC/GvpD/RAD55 family RecA-like ATPase